MTQGHLVKVYFGRVYGSLLLSFLMPSLTASNSSSMKVFKPSTLDWILSKVVKVLFIFSTLIIKSWILFVMTGKLTVAVSMKDTIEEKTLGNCVVQRKTKTAIKDRHRVNITIGIQLSTKVTTMLDMIFAVSSVMFKLMIPITKSVPTKWLLR